MALERKTELRRGELSPISDRRLREEFGGRVPFNSLERRGGTRSSAPARRWKDTGPDEAMVALIWARDLGRCACCGAVIPPGSPRNQEWCIAHRLLRAHGVDNRASNLYLSCGNPFWGCEHETHKFPARSYAAGRMVRSTAVPAEVSMVHAVLGGPNRVLLLDDGLWRAVEAEFIPKAEVDDEQPF